VDGASPQYHSGLVERGRTRFVSFRAAGLPQ
jgi:hypothetical protein